MRAVIQRVSHAGVTVDGKVLGKIGKGFLILLGVSDEDTEEVADRLADKICKLRIFEDENGKTNLSLADVGGELLVISQFTLYADCRKGNRPSFIKAGAPGYGERAVRIFYGAVQTIREESGTRGIRRGYEGGAVERRPVHADAGQL